MLAAGKKFDVADFVRMQQDVTSLPARRFQAAVRNWHPADGTPVARALAEILQWDAVLTTESHAALLYEMWMSKLPAALFGEMAAKADLDMQLRKLEAGADPAILQKTLEEALAEADRRKVTTWGSLHQLTLAHPLGKTEFQLGPVARPGDANTVNATSGTNFRQTNGASWREVLDVGDWDRSVMTNVPGESGNPGSSHYSDLLADWAAGRYHPLPFSRKAVEAATEERIEMVP
jgi:penicillin amidase